MKTRLFFSAIILIIYIPLFGEKGKVIITADISRFPGKLPISTHEKWQGDDTLVPVFLQDRSRTHHTMGAEYLIFANPGNPMDPNNDSVGHANMINLKLWRQKAIIKNLTYTWVIETNIPREITNESLLGGTYLVFPGDSIHITYDNGKILFSGKGSAKFQAHYEINKAKESIKYPDGNRYPKDLNRYLELNRYLNQQVSKITPILESTKPKISQQEYDWIKGVQLGNIEYYRCLYFSFIPRPAKHKNQKLPYSTEDLIRVWDTTMYTPLALWVRSPDVQNNPGVHNLSYIYNFIQTELVRKFNFESQDSILNEPVQKKLLYQKIKTTYTGLFRERFLCDFIEEQITQEMGSYNWFAQSILKDYYNTSKFPAYKGWMKQWEQKMREKYPATSILGVAPLFNLNDQKGNKYSHSGIAGKFTVVNFWYSGCEPCKQTTKTLTKLQEQYSTDTNIIFLHVSVDSDKVKWKKSINEGLYVPKDGIQLFTNGLGRNHEMIADFDVAQFPTLRFIDHDGKIVVNENKPFVTFLSEDELVDLVNKQLARLKDGPYVFDEKGGTKAYFIDGNNVQTQDSMTSFSFSTDQYAKPLNFSLQKQIVVPPSTYANPSKMLVLSDIEGNFTAFRKLLTANKVIDDNYNWTFGDGHLVFAGDMFDRGEQVTECLWLTYSLEEKAKKTGGFVHFILGNHDIMNLSGDDRYVKEKYKKNYALLGKTLAEIYNEQSVLGQWLRTKNIIEKIGNNLFTHGGISSQVNNMQLTLEQINNIARPYYDRMNTASESPDENITILFNSRKSPFWYRHYYQQDYFSKSNNELIPRATENQLDSTCRKFDVDHIITGHTIVADTVTVHYGGKVINIDTRHVAGKSEALLIENGLYYRVSATGHKILLFKENGDLLNGKQARNN